MVSGLIISDASDVGFGKLPLVTLYLSGATHTASSITRSRGGL